MKTKALFLMVLLSALMALPVRAAASEFPPSINWRQGQPRVSLDNLRGKMVVIVFFQSWCGICNKWSPDLIKQMDEQYGQDMDVVLVALKTDSNSISDAEGYLEQRGADLGNWIIGTDPGGAYMQSFNFGSSLWLATIVGPDGEIAEKTKAGMYSGGQGNKQFALARPDLKEQHGSGTIRRIPADLDYDDRLRPVVRALEFGDFEMGMGYLKRVPSDLKEDAEKIKQAFLSQLEAELPALKKTVADEAAEDRYPAYKQVQLIAKSLRRTDVGDAANEIVQSHRRDAALRNEEKAERAFKTMMLKANKLKPDERERLLKPALKQFAQAFEGTYYGRQALAMAE